MNRFLSILFVAALAQASLPAARGDVFGSGANSFEIEFVTIGNPGNPPDTTGRPSPAGSVPYAFRIGKYEISEQMIDKANVLGGLGITKDTRGSDFPATSVTWYEAARFVNWLNSSTRNVPAYKFSAAGQFQLWNDMDAGFDPANPYRNRIAKYYLPDVDEWYKAAYYDPMAGVYYDYPTGSDSVPDGIDFVGDQNFDAVFKDAANNAEPNRITDVGQLSPYGSSGQGGNVFEWEETVFDRINDSDLEIRAVRGGGWTTASYFLAATDRMAVSSSFERELVGFRVGSVIPEPSTVLLIGAASLALISMGRRVRS